MNNVHEPGPNGDSEPIPSRKTRSKPSQVHEHQNWPNWAPRHAQVRVGLVVSWPGLAVSWPRPPAVSQLQATVSQLRVRAVSRAPCPEPQHRVAGAPMAVSWAQGAVSQRASAVSWACVRVGMAVSWPASRHSAALPPVPPSHNTACVLRYTPAI